MLTQERLKQLLNYSPETGLFYWKVDRGGKHIGEVAGVQRESGYIIIGIDNRLRRAHQLAWLWMTGEWPSRFIDHIDTDKANNRWANLRLATKSQNMANRGPMRRNSSGFKGVSPYLAGAKYGKPWQSGIQFKGKKIHIGHFVTAEEAHAAYVTIAKKLFGEFARAA